MATLQELRPMIDDGWQVVLSLPHDHPQNLERKDLRIFVHQVKGIYIRKVSFEGKDAWAPPSQSSTWDNLIGGSSGIEATSDQWTPYERLP